MIRRKRKPPVRTEDRPIPTRTWTVYMHRWAYSQISCGEYTSAQRAAREMRYQMKLATRPTLDGNGNPSCMDKASVIFTVHCCYMRPGSIVRRGDQLVTNTGRTLDVRPKGA